MGLQVCLILGQVGDGGECHHLHFDETMEILIGYAVLQIGSIVTNLNACSSSNLSHLIGEAWKLEDACLLHWSQNRKSFGKRYDSADFWLQLTPSGNLVSVPGLKLKLDWWQKHHHEQRTLYRMA